MKFFIYLIKFLFEDYVIYFEELLPLPLIVKGIGGEVSLIRFMATVSQLFSTLFISTVVKKSLLTGVEKKMLLGKVNTRQECIIE